MSPRQTGRPRSSVPANPLSVMPRAAADTFRVVKWLRTKLWMIQYISRVLWSPPTDFAQVSVLRLYAELRCLGELLGASAWLAWISSFPIFCTVSGCSGHGAWYFGRFGPFLRACDPLFFTLAFIPLRSVFLGPVFRFSPAHCRPRKVSVRSVLKVLNSWLFLICFNFGYISIPAGVPVSGSVISAGCALFWIRYNQLVSYPTEISSDPMQNFCVLLKCNCPKGNFSTVSRCRKPVNTCDRAFKIMFTRRTIFSDTTRKASFALRTIFLLKAVKFHFSTPAANMSTFLICWTS